MQRYSQEVNKGEPWAEPDPQGCWVLHTDAEAAIAAAVAAEREQRQQAREELVQAWNNLPDALRCHPGLKRLYAAAQRA